LEGGSLGNTHILRSGVEGARKVRGENTFFFSDEGIKLGLEKSSLKQGHRQKKTLARQAPWKKASRKKGSQKQIQIKGYTEKGSK